MDRDRVGAAAPVQVAADAVRGERRRELVDGGKWIEIEIDNVHAALQRGRVLRLEAVRQVDRATERVEGGDHRVAEQRHVVLPSWIDVTADAHRPLRIGDVEDLRAGPHGANERVVVDHTVVVGARLELDSRANDPAHVGDVGDVLGRARQRAERADRLARERYVVGRVEGLALRFLNGHGGLRLERQLYCSERVYAA